MKRNSIKEWLDGHQDASDEGLEEYLCEHMDEIDDYLKVDDEYDMEEEESDDSILDFFTLDELESMGAISYPKTEHVIMGEEIIMVALKSGDGDAVGY